MTEKNTARLEAFSDGIFGVAITLLALEIGIQPYAGAGNANLWQKVVDQWPEYFTYFNSFATVLLMWMGHNKIISQLQRADQSVMLLNGLVLLFVVLFPFPTRLVGIFIGTAAQSTAVAVYAGFTGFITLSLLLLNMYIVNHRHLLSYPEKSIPWYRHMIRQQLAGFLVYELTALLALYYSVPALVITFLMWVYWGISTKDQKYD